MNKIKLIIICLLSLLVVYLIYEVNKSSKIPDHIHSIDDKPFSQRTDEEKIVVLERNLQRDANNVDDMIELSDLYIKTSQISKAKKLIEKVLEIAPENKIARDRLNFIKSL